MLLKRAGYVLLKRGGYVLLKSGGYVLLAVELLKCHLCR